MKLNEIFVIKEAPQNGSKRGDKAEAVISSSAISQFEAADFIDLAMLCVDQAGVNAQVQAQIEKMIRQGIPQGE
jgi:hypothetical protein